MRALGHVTGHHQQTVSCADNEEREAELHQYYSTGSQYGVPASVILFQLAHSMQLGRSYLLWCASYWFELPLKVVHR